MRTNYYGAPGASAAAMARSSRRTRTGLTIAFAVVAVAAIVGGYPLVGILVLAAGAAGRRAVDGRVRRAESGRQGEAVVAEHLAGVRAEAVLFDVPIGSGDVDAVVLGPMAAAVEVKRGSGRVRARADGRMTAGGRPIPGNPARQAIAGAAAIGRLAGGGLWVESILCITDLRGRPRRLQVGSNTVTICAPWHLGKVLRRLPRPLTRGEGRALGDEIAWKIDPSLRSRRRV